MNTTINHNFLIPEKLREDISEGGLFGANIPFSAFGSNMESGWRDAGRCYHNGGGRSYERPSFHASRRPQSPFLSPGCALISMVRGPSRPLAVGISLAKMLRSVCALSRYMGSVHPPGISNFETGDGLVSSFLEWGEDTTGFPFWNKFG